MGQAGAPTPPWAGPYGMGMNNLYLNDTEMLIVLGPEHAATIAAEGWSKPDVQQFSLEQARVPVRRAGGQAR